MLEKLDQLTIQLTETNKLLTMQEKKLSKQLFHKKQMKKKTLTLSQPIMRSTQKKLRKEKRQN